MPVAPKTAILTAFSRKAGEVPPSERDMEPRLHRGVERARPVASALVGCERRVEPSDRRAELDPVAVELREADFACGATGQQPAGDREAAAHALRGRLEDGRGKREEDWAAAEQPELDAACSPDAYEPVGGALHFLPVALPERSGAYLVEGDGGCLEHDSLLGLDGAVGRLPLRGLPARQGHGRMCTRRRTFRRLEAATGRAPGRIITRVKRVNVQTQPVEYDESDPEGCKAGMSRFGPSIGASMLGASISSASAGPGDLPVPLRVRGTRSGCSCSRARVTVRHPKSAGATGAGRGVCFPEGPQGAHKVTNTGEAGARVLMFSTMIEPSVAIYPDSDKLGVWPGDDRDKLMVKRSSAVDYWEGEA